MAFVLDASSTLAWCFGDEATPESRHLLELAQTLVPIYVPSHWPVEVLNALIRAKRRGRLDDLALDDFLGTLPSYHFVVDARSFVEQWNDAIPLTRLYGLSAYDALYLSLAIRLQVPLATNDDKLRTAATIEGISLIV